MLSPLFDTISGDTSFAPAWRGHPISERCSVSSSHVAAGVICPIVLACPCVAFFASARRGIVPSPLLLPPPHHLIAVSLILLACHAHQSRSPSGRVSSAAAYRSHRLGCLSVRSPRVLIRPASSTRGAGRTAERVYSRAWCGCPDCLPLRLRRDVGRRRFHSASCRFGLFGLLARHLAIAGQYLG